MTPETITEAINEAKKFIRLANEAIVEHEESGNHAMWGTKKTGALRRSSMDLTRALSEMRKPL